MALLFWVMLSVLVVGIVGIASILVYAVAFAGRRRAPKRVFPAARISLLDRVAAAVGGLVINEPGKYKVPFLRTTVGETRVALVLMATDDVENGPYVVHIETPIAGQSFVEAWPLGSPYQPQRVTSGLPEVKTGDPAFDAAYLVRADDAAHARAVLSPELRESLERMRRFGRGGRVRFDLHPHKAVYLKEEQVEDEGSLRALVATAIEATRLLKESLESQSQMEFYDDAPKRVVMVSCPICGAPIRQGKVACRRCKTPHHEECWKYFGACSMYACGEKSYEL